MSMISRSKTHTKSATNQRTHPSFQRKSKLPLVLRLERPQIIPVRGAGHHHGHVRALIAQIEERKRLDLLRFESEGLEVGGSTGLEVRETGGEPAEGVDIGGGGGGGGVDIAGGGGKKALGTGLLENQDESQKMREIGVNLSFS